MSEAQDTTTPGQHGQADRDPSERETASPDITEALREFSASGRAGFKAANDVFKALRILVAADFALARSAFGRTLALMAVAIVFGASSWLLLMAALIVALTTGLGWSWTMALLLTAVVSAIATAVAAWMGMR
ncbi:MAG: phage holin family protein, partial [Lysobacter sp.]